VTEAELPRLAAATRAVVASCINPSSHDHIAIELHLQQARLERVRQVIRKNLRSPTLTPKHISRLVGMSRSQLYRLFEPIGGVARYIQRARLREACRVLSDAEDCRDIREVAENLGFFDPSSFSRAFRQEYGCSPRDMRMSARSGARTAPTYPVPGALPPADFAALLRNL
jgi:AraC-like DNA-binding protein